MKDSKKKPMPKKIGVKVLIRGTKNARFSKLGKDSCCGGRYQRATGDFFNLELGTLAVPSFL